MARIRSVHPGQATDEDFVCMSYEGRLAAIMLRCECDDQGVFEWKPLTLKMRLFPADNLDMVELLAELQQANQIVKFEADGKSYGAMRNFCKFQRPKKPNAVHPLPEPMGKYVGNGDASTAPSSEPKAAKEGVSSEPEQVERGVSSPPVPHQFPTGTEKSIQMEEGGGNRRGNLLPSPNLITEPSSLPSPSATADAAATRREAIGGLLSEGRFPFEPFWEAYPKRLTEAGKLVKSGKKDTREYWSAMAPKSQREAVAGLARYAEGAGSKPVDPIRYLRRRLWENEVEDAPPGALSPPGSPPAKWVEHEQNRREITKRLIEESENASNDQGNLISDGRKFDGPEDYAQRAEPDRGAERFGEIVELPAFNQSRI